MLETNNSVTKDMFTAAELENKKRPETAATSFKNSLAQLMVILMSKEPSYIRCIKPNNNKMPSIFSDTVVRHQVSDSLTHSVTDYLFGWFRLGDQQLTILDRFDESLRECLLR